MSAEYEPTNLAAADKRQEETALEAQKRHEQEAADWRHLLGDKRGRRIVWGLMAKAGVFRVSFNPDPYQTAFSEGQRNLGLSLLAAVMTHAPETLLRMQNEAE